MKKVCNEPPVVNFYAVYYEYIDHTLGRYKTYHGVDDLAVLQVGMCVTANDSFMV